MPDEKSELRRAMRARLRELGPERATHSAALCAALARHPAYVAANVVALFDPLPSEPAIDALWHLNPRRFLYPRIAAETLELFEVRTVDDLAHASDRRFREPHAALQRPHPLDDVDLILVPGLAFTRAGDRLGRGGGYYDRLLATLSPQTNRLGVCFDLQLVPSLPSEPHDQRVDEVITEVTHQADAPQFPSGEPRHS